jgi:poly(3-hydroxybutyrate) depolymerase
MAYHWLGGTAEDVVGPYNWYGLWDLADNSTIFIAPQGIREAGPGWPNTNGEDVAFTDAILDQVENDLCIDKTRIFANGFSYGAGMSYALACARADVFRGVALYSGGVISGCDGGNTPIAYFQAHGLGDSVLPIAGARTMRDNFAAVNGCTALTPPEPASGSGTHICTDYQGCSDGHPVTWCAFDGGHTPSPNDSGQGSSWIPQQVWNFINRF